MSSTEDVIDARAGSLREQLQLLADFTSAAVAYVDNERRFELTNSAFKRRFGTPETNATAGSFFQGVCSPAVDRYLETSMARKTALRARLDCANNCGATERLRLQVVPYVTEAGVSGAFVLFNELETLAIEPEPTVEEQENDRLINLQRMAKLGEMAAGLAHEVRQPLAAIGNYANAAIRMLRRDSSKDEVVAIITQISEQTERANHVVANARNMIGVGDNHFRRFDLQRVVRDSLGLIERRARETNVDVRLAIENTVPTVRGDQAQIEQILVNLMTNAIDAMADCDTRVLTVDLDTTDETIRVRICDTGCGIPEKTLTSIFKAFETSKSDGMGMGLSISRALAERHGGQLWVETDREEGAGFVLELPIAEETEDESAT